MTKPNLNFTPEQIQYLEKKIAASVVEEGDCMIWQLCLENAAPVVNTPRNIGRRSVRARLFLMELVYKIKRPNNGFNYVPVATCGDPRCLKRDHQAWVTHSKSQKMVAERTGYASNPVRNSKISKTLNRRKLSDEQVAAARASEESIKQKARDYGISFNSMRSIVRGETYKDYNSHWAGLMR